MKEEKKIETPEVETPKVEDKPKGVLVDADKLEQMLKDFNDMSLRVNRMEEKQNAGQNLDKPKARGNSRVFLKILRDLDNKPHIVTSWKSSPNNRLIYSPVNANQVVGEILKAEYYSAFDNWSSGEVDQVYFTRSGELVYGEVIEQNGSIMTLKIDELSDNCQEDVRKLFNEIKEPIKIEVTFVNP